MKLREYDADPQRVERIRARCRALLAARAREPESRASRGAVAGTWLEPALAVGLGVLYLADAVFRVIAATAR